MSDPLSEIEHPAKGIGRADRCGSALRRSLIASHLSLFTSHLLLLSCLISCASKEKKTKTDYASLPMGQRFDRQIKDPFGISSPFQKEVYNASKNVKTSKFKADEARGSKRFFGADDKFKTANFAQGHKASNAADRSFSGADDKSKMGNSTFKTKQDPLGEKVSSASNDTSRFADDVFNTRSNSGALKAASNVKRPLIQSGEPGYSEEEVKKLLNKN